MKARIDLTAVLLVGAVVAVTACGGDKPAAQKAAPIEEVATPLPPSELETQLPPSVREAVLKPFTGDLDELVKRRAVRVGVTFNRTFYFVDRGVQRGIAYEYGQLMEERLNKHFKTGTGNRIHVIFLPLPREMLLSALVDGKVDMVAAQVPVTPELAEARRLQRSHPDERQPDPGHRSRRAGDCLHRGPVRQGSLRPQTGRLLPEPARAQREVQGRGEAAGGDSGGAAEPGGRRPARDGERRPDPGRRGRRLSRRLLEEGLSEPHRPRQHRAAHRRYASPSRSARTTRSCSPP